MTQKTRILVVGIGGVGGYFGGLLAKHYEGSNEVEIIFLARGEHLKNIQADGLKVQQGASAFTARPHLATDSADAIGTADYILLCTKAYDLEASLQQIKPCVGENTVIVPLLNGVDAPEKIKNLLPHSTVPEGCVYIISSIKSAGVVENSGNMQKLYFGLQNETNTQLMLLEKLLQDAGIEASLSNNITSIVWEKFLFVSPLATATSCFDNCIGQLLEEKEETLLQLIDEVRLIALAKGISLDEDITQKTLDKIRSLPYEATSSMHRDYQQLKQQTEVESLTGYVVQAGQALNIPTPTYYKAYQSLLKKNITPTASH